MVRPVARATMVPAVQCTSLPSGPCATLALLLGAISTQGYVIRRHSSGYSPAPSTVFRYRGRDLTTIAAGLGAPVFWVARIRTAVGPRRSRHTLRQVSDRGPLRHHPWYPTRHSGPPKRSGVAHFTGGVGQPRPRALDSLTGNAKTSALADWAARHGADRTATVRSPPRPHNGGAA